MFNFPVIRPESKIVSVRYKILFHVAVSKAVIPLETLALNVGSVSVKLLNFLFQKAVSTAVIPLAILPLKEGSVSPKLLNLLFQKEISLSVIPLEILLRNTGSDSVFHNAVSAAEIPFAILALN